MPVRFSKTRKVRVFPKMAEDERDQIWWNQEDFRSFKKECWKTLKTNQNGSPLKDDQCLRGLEDWTKDRYTERRKRMRDAVLGVILEQECLQSEGRKDEFRISMQYCKLTEESMRLAQLKGAIDAKIRFGGDAVTDNNKSRNNKASPDRKRRNPFSSASSETSLETTKKESRPIRSHLFSKSFRRVSL